MKIYIYGNQSFKKEIHETLDHSNIKFKLDNNTVIEEIESLEKLKTTIENNPKDIYLIDDEKIIKKNSLNKKLKFLAPKDGIEEEYLLDSGIADLAIDSLKELPKYIIKKYEELKLLEPEIEEENKIEEIKSSIELDDELSMLLAKENSIKKSKSEDLTPVDDLDEIFDLDNNIDNLDDLIGSIDRDEEIKDSDDFAQITNFNDDFGLNNISFDYDDDNVLYKEIDENVVSTKNTNIIEELDFLGEEVIEDDEDDFSDLDKVNSELFGGFDFLNEEIQEGTKKIEKEENIIDSDKIDEELVEEYDFMKEYIKTEEIIPTEEIDQSLQGDKMNDEFFELDSLNEKDLLEALNYKVEDNSSKSEYKPQVSSTKSETLSIDSSNVNDLSLLISKLLNNKTLEITIKIKD
ncbi:hypothetical protein CKA55_02825 [Arcobacter suis]|uniref:Uncharacterized protein n=1 Tax=Arcobacter suis CECT 7833 TaxID=663365 RepID=A0AAD0WPL3_9BACT|nr:hypothetical protein [Arcobacter suis]AXX88786.1 hypothetical protein ASUIS_0278 [Arcobacter suis CECT 7833]RWS47347.1 hypothetical protein CKA55_02825 [Arcobacter suis]